MTHYWWMHWFWITLWLSITCCEEIPTTPLHSISTNLTTDVSSDSYRSEKAIFNIGGSPTTIYPVYTKNTTAQNNITLNKFTKLSSKNVDFHFSTLTIKNTKDYKETVINPIHTTDLNNISDNQMPNTSFNAINYTNNLTYLEEEVNNNQSLSRNSQRIDIEEDEDDLATSEGNLSAAGITGITLGCVVAVGMICGISFFLYRTRGFNRPQVLNDRCSNPDSSGYIDDASVRDNSEEMYSLDNDSFLNSLEAMTIQNYWTDTVKHTKL
ncbi:uncharacterized protein LOC108912417 [Anoplophora glabripennis]|uniref:uncharacterized protein LOC108912417 n=1 Tax=Anoplophora glabripennis TaxID=217634 RepID=UPI000873A536|nr:uncharacterized protein LOC108912417 [Anoplophora glabripennis]